MLTTSPLLSTDFGRNTSSGQWGATASRISSSCSFHPQISSTLTGTGEALENNEAFCLKCEPFPRREPVDISVASRGRVQWRVALRWRRDRPPRLKPKRWVVVVDDGQLCLTPCLIQTVSCPRPAQQIQTPPNPNLSIRTAASIIRRPRPPSYPRFWATHRDESAPFQSSNSYSCDKSLLFSLLFLSATPHIKRFWL